MAKSKDCPKCGTSMTAIDEKWDSDYQINIVTYQCWNGNCNHITTVQEPY